jgi:hypothetical protein
MADTWNMDDDQMLCAPQLVDLFLRLLEAELHAIGATRGSDKDVKSCANIVGHEAFVARYPTERCTDYLQQPCECPAPGLESAVLRIDCGLSQSGTRQLREHTRKVRELNEHIGAIGDAKIELVLMRSCASACKIIHLLRTAPKIRIS